MRRRRAKLRTATPDSKFNDAMAGKFINSLMQDGQKYTAEKIFYTALQKIEEKTKKQGIEVFRTAMENIKPTMEVKARRIGGATYQVPSPLRPSRKMALAIRWLISAARDKKGLPMADKLAEELMLASEEKGNAFKKKEDTHKMAQANKVFAHFKW